MVIQNLDRNLEDFQNLDVLAFGFQTPFENGCSENVAKPRSENLKSFKPWTAERGETYSTPPLKTGP